MSNIKRSVIKSEKKNSKRFSSSDERISNMKSGIIVFAVIISISKGCLVVKDEHKYKSITYFCKQEEEMNPKRNCSTFETLQPEDMEDIEEFKYECRSVKGREDFGSDFKKLSKLRVVDLSHTQMSRYLKFPYSSNVRKIDISNNWLESLPSDAFTAAKEVSIINCSHNALQSFNSSFKTLHNLEKLDLSFNEVHLVENDFIDNENLRYLNLEGNLIVRFKFRTILSSLNHKIVVHFSANIIRELDVNCTTQKCPFGGLNDGDYFENILFFFAPGNRIQNASVLLLKLGPKLQKLDLSRNYIRSLDSSIEALRDKSELDYFDIRDNPLTEFNFKRFLPSVNHTVEVFLPTNSIEELDISCATSTCYFKGFADGKIFENLQHLNASGTQIENASIILDKIGSKIETLDLSFNHIRKIDSNMLKSFKNLKKLIWKHANISHIANNAFDSQMKNLLELDLSNNLLIHIGFSEIFTKLKKLHLHGNSLTNINISPDNFPELISLKVTINDFTCDYRESIRDRFLGKWNNVIQLYHNETQIGKNRCQTTA